MKKLAILMAIAAVAAVSPIQAQPAQAMSAAQANALVAQQNYINSLQANQQYANYGGATVYSNGAFSNNGVSWNGADPAGGWRGGAVYPTAVVRAYPSTVVVYPQYPHRHWR